MKIQCNACEAAEANVLCCADEAALCWACDEKVHAANKLAGKHQRVPLTGSSSSLVPKCDICQEAAGYFFCLEDRALLCRKCDVSIHSANSYVSAHQRFLLTGVKVGTDPSGPVEPFAKEQLSPSPPSKSMLRSLSGENNGAVSNHADKNMGFSVNKTVFSGGTMTGTFPGWPLDEFFGMTDFDQNYGFMDPSSKADSGKFGSLEGSPIYHPADQELDFKCSNQVPEIQWTVPEIPSPPTASGLNWPKSFQNPFAENSMFVPDICGSSFPDTHYSQSFSSIHKCRRP